MIKQPIQPLKFYKSLAEVNYFYENRAHDYILTDLLFLPAFQIKFDSRDEDITDFQTNEITLVQIGTAAETDLSYRINVMGVFRYGEYQNLIVYHYPLRYLLTEGEYYLRISDGVETWFSEVFKVCDLFRNIIRSWETISGWQSSSTTDVLSLRDFYQISVLEIAGNGASFVSNEFDIDKDDPLDFYCISGDSTLSNSGYGDDLHFNLIDAITDETVSNQIDSIKGCKHERFIPTETTTVRFHGWLENGEVTSAYFRLYLFRANPDNYQAIRYTNSKNICSLIYSQQEGWVNSLTQTGYDEDENPLYSAYWSCEFFHYLIVNSMPPMARFETQETVKEDDEKNTYLINGAQQEWYALRFAIGENFLKALGNIHLYDTVELNYNWSALIITHNRTEYSPVNFFEYDTSWIYRELVCSVNSCDFDICCPNLKNADDYVIALPACDDGLREIYDDGANVYLFECVDGIWCHMTDEEEVDGDGFSLSCIFLENYPGFAHSVLGGCSHWFYTGAPGCEWAPFAEIRSVTDNTDGTATVNIGFDSLSTFIAWGKLGVIVQIEIDDGGGWVECGDPYTCTEVADEVTCTTGAGTFDFRLRIYTETCEYCYSNIDTQTITE